jgi:hypothetical protein
MRLSIPILNQFQGYRQKRRILGLLDPQTWQTEARTSALERASFACSGQGPNLAIDMVRGPPVFLNVKLRNSSLEQFSRKSNFHSQILFGESSNGIKWLQVIPDQRLHKDMVYACVCYVHVICACIWCHKNYPFNPTHVGVGLMHPHDGRYAKSMRHV